MKQSTWRIIFRPMSLSSKSLSFSYIYVYLLIANCLLLKNDVSLAFTEPEAAWQYFRTVIYVYYACFTRTNDYFMFIEAVWWELAPAATLGHWRGRHALCWWPGNWNSAPGAACGHFHQWTNPSWEICQKGYNSASKFNNMTTTLYWIKCMLFDSQNCV